MPCPYANQETKTTERIVAPQSCVTFGFELEYSFEFNPNILDHYKPCVIEDSVWQGYSAEERLLKARQWMQMTALTFYGRDTFDKCENSLDFFPGELRSEGATFKLEMNTEPFESLAEAAEFLYSCEAILGPAQIQAHVVHPALIDPKGTQFQGFRGYAVFESDHAILKTLVDEFKEYQRCERIPAGHFVSRFLGVPTEATLNALENREGLTVEFDFNEFRRHRSCMPSLRSPLLYSGVVPGVELRQWDTPSVGEMPLSGRVELLLLSIQFFIDSVSHKNGFQAFEAYRFASSEKKQILSEIFGAEDFCEIWKLSEFSKVTLGCQDNAIESILILPLRNWENYPALTRLSAQSRESMESHICLARDGFVTAVLKIQNDLQLTHITQLQGLNHLRIALAKWACDSNLGSLFTDELFESFLI